MKKIAAYAKLLRIPGVAGLAIPPVIGAITVGEYDPFVLTILFIIGALSGVYGFILNDYIDVELDALVDDLKKKPLVGGIISKKAALLITITFVLLCFFFIFLLWQGETLDDYKFVALLCVVVAGILGTVYDIYGKNIVGSDFLVAIAMSLIFLFGALAVGTPTVLTWVVFLLTFNQALHMNAVEGGIKDADHDYKMGVRNIALAVGVKVEGMKITIPLGFKAFGMGIRLFSTLLLFSPFVLFDYSYHTWQLAILALGVIGFLFFSIKLISIQTFDRNKIRKYIAIQSFLRYSLVPIMLIYAIGEKLAVVLIILPIVWYIIFTPLLGERLFKPRM